MSNVHEEFYTYLTVEERELLYEDIKDEEAIVLPKETELRTKSLYFNYDIGYMFRIKHKKREFFIYNKKKTSLLYELIILVGEKEIFGKVKYINIEFSSYQLFGFY